MKCFAPYMKPSEHGYLPFPCGNCYSCRASQSMTWSLRMHLESLYYQHNGYITLTYAPEFLPENRSLMPSHLQSFFKRLRRRLSYRIKYFACGEYGEEGGRPHYHAIVFGLKASDFHIIRECWTYGFADTKIPVPEAFSYVAGYVTKKIGKVSEWTAKNPNQIPPFQRSSLGLGLRFIMEQVPQFTTTLLINGKPRYIGRYLRNKLAEKFGILEEVKELGIENLALNMSEILNEFLECNPDYPRFDNRMIASNAWYWKYEGLFNEVLALAKIRSRNYHKGKKYAKSAKSPHAYRRSLRT